MLRKKTICHTQNLLNFCIHPIIRKNMISQKLGRLRMTNVYQISMRKGLYQLDNGGNTHTTANAEGG